MFLIACLITTVLFIIVSIISSGLAYVLLAQNLGSDVAWRRLRKAIPFYLLGCLVFVIVGYIGTAKSWQIYSLYTLSEYISLLSLVLSLMHFIYVATWTWRKKEAGFLLLDVGRLSTSNVAFVLSGIQALLATQQTYVFITQVMQGTSDSNSFSRSNLYIVLVLWSLAISCFLFATSRLEFRENGICSNFTLISWNNILFHKWEGKNHQTLTLKTKTIFPLEMLCQGAVYRPLWSVRRGC